MPKLAQLAQAGGNTKPPRRRLRSVCLTINNYSNEEYLMVLDHCKTKCKNYIIGKEVGTENKVNHLQIYFQYNNPVEFKSIKSLFPRAHIEPAKGKPSDNYKYCSKDGDYVSNMGPKLSLREKLIKKCLEKYEKVVWKPWQESLLKLLCEEPDDRVIHWVYERKGNVGKTFVMKYLAVKHKAIVANGTKTDIFNQVNTMIDNEINPEIILVNVPRGGRCMLSSS